MPSAKMKLTCQKCGHRNVVRSKFCNQCGSALDYTEQPVTSTPEESRQSEHKDIAHPITPECREYIQKKVLDGYNVEAINASNEGATIPLGNDSNSDIGG